MAKRPVFIPQGEVPFARAIETEFSWNGGFAPSQKQKNIRALHGAFLAAGPPPPRHCSIKIIFPLFMPKAHAAGILNCCVTS